jgi:hypothetical protein
MIVESIDYVTIIHHACSHFSLSLSGGYIFSLHFKSIFFRFSTLPGCFSFSLRGRIWASPPMIEQTQQQQQQQSGSVVLLTWASSFWWDDCGVEARLPEMTIGSPESSTWWLAWMWTSGCRTTLYWELSPWPTMLPHRPPDGSHEKLTLPVCDTKTHSKLNVDSFYIHRAFIYLKIWQHGKE